MGELLRVLASGWPQRRCRRDAAADQILGEELILFRDGRAGRASSIRAAAIEARRSITARSRIRHPLLLSRWLFDVEGQCLEMPAEPNPIGPQCRGAPTLVSGEDRYGLVFAYLGRRRKAVLRATNAVEVMGPGEFVEPTISSIGSGGIAIAPCNWLQHFENVVDPYHVPILHGSFSGAQFVEQMSAFPR